MTDAQTDDQPDDQQSDAPAMGEPTDISAASLDVEQGAAGDTPATSDPDEFVDDDGTLGGTGGGSAGGAG